MRACIQRVSEARVTVDGEVTGQIGRGLVVLLGVGAKDGEAEVDWLAEKIVGLRIFEDDAGKMNRSLAEVGGAMLVVSQFTLYGDCAEGATAELYRGGAAGAGRAVVRIVCRASGRAGGGSCDGAVSGAYAGVACERWAGDVCGLIRRKMVVSRWVLVVGWKTGRGFLGWLRGKTEGVSFGPWGDFSQFGNCSLSRKATSCFEGDKFSHVARNVQN